MYPTDIKAPKKQSFHKENPSTFSVLMVGTETKIFDETSKARQRIIGYGTLVDKLYVIVFTKKDNKFKKQWLTPNIWVYPTSHYKIISFLKAFWIGVHVLILRKERYTLITVQDPFGAALLGYLLSRIFHLPLQIQIHTTFLSPFWRESYKNTLYQTLAKFFVTKATCIRVVSEKIKSSLVNSGIPEVKISVLPIFTNVKHIIDYQPKFNLHTKYPQFNFMILMASRLVKQKNISLAIEAVGNLIKKYPNIGLIIIGSGPEEENLKSESHEFKKNIIFEPWTSDIVSYYKGADMFLLTSNYEGWGMTVIEAMASGLPVIMTDVGLAGEVIKNGKNGIVVPIRDRQAIIESIEKLYENMKERKRFTKAGRDTVMNLKPDTWEAYLELYKKSLISCLSK